MKYIITDLNEIVIGPESTFHRYLAKAANGSVVAAGHVRVRNGRFEVYGSSIGYGLDATKEDEDALNLQS